MVGYFKKVMGSGEVSSSQNALRQIIKGSYTDDITVAGTLGDIGVGFIPGIGQAQSARDLWHDLTNWEWSAGHITQTAFSAFGLVPFVGGLKVLGKADKVGKLINGVVKHGDEVASAVQSGKKTARIVAGADKGKIGYNWTAHGNKHVPPKNISWKKVVESTKNGGSAKYHPDINIETLERHVWEKGTKVTNGKDWKVMKFDKTIGASNGMETQYIRVEMSANTIHGHPITQAEFLRLTK